MKLTIEQLADKVNELITEKCKEKPELIKDGRQSSVLSTRRIRDYITKGLIEKPVGTGREKWFDSSHVDALVSLRLLQHNGLSDYYIKNSLSSTSTSNDAWPFPRVQDNNLNDFSVNSNKSSKSSDNWPFPRVQDNKSNDFLVDSNKSKSSKSSDAWPFPRVQEKNLNKDSDEAMQNNAMEFLKSLQDQNAPKTNNSLNGLAHASSPPIKNIFTSTDSIAYAANPNDSNLLKSLSQTKYRQFNEYVVDEKLGVFLKTDSKTDLELQKKLVEVIKNEIIKHNKENNND